MDSCTEVRVEARRTVTGWVIVQVMRQKRGDDVVMMMDAWWRQKTQDVLIMWMGVRNLEKSGMPPSFWTEHIWSLLKWVQWVGWSQGCRDGQRSLGGL